MFRIEAVCVCALFVGASGSVLLAQDRAGEIERDGPGPVDSTQSVSAGADSDITDRAYAGASTNAGSPGHATGSYAGVVPGAASKAPPAAKAAKASNGPTITWPGFQMRPDGSSRVFIQSTAPLEPKVLTTAEGKFDVQLPCARVAAKTNRLPLDTRFFNTPVTKVSVSASPGGAVVQLDLRASIAPSVSTESAPSGYFFTYIELPKGDYLMRLSATPKQSATPSVDAQPKQQPEHPSKVIGRASASASAGSEESSGAAVQGEASARGGLKIGR